MGKSLQERKEPTRVLRAPWSVRLGQQRITFVPTYEPGERKLVVHTLTGDTIEAPVDSKRADVLALYRERFQL